MKTIIFTLTQTPCNLKITKYDNIFGLGDIIRGLIGVYQLCKKHNINLYYNTELHPIYEYLNNDSMYSEYIKNNRNKIYFYNNENDIIKNLNNNEPLLLLSNIIFTNNISEDCKLFVKKFINTNDYFLQKFNNTINNLKINESYDTIHYRIAGLNGDQKQFHYKKNLNIFLQHALNNYKKNMIIITDNDEFKKILPNNIKYTNSKIGHFGYDKDPEVFFGILFDLFILKNSNIIYYHPHCGPSGFIKIINYLYGTELMVIL